MTEWGMWPKRPEQCECRGNYEGQHLRCQMCGSAHRWGEERVSYRRSVCKTYASDDPLRSRHEHGWEACAHLVGVGYGPTREAALSDLKRKVREREARCPWETPLDGQCRREGGHEGGCDAHVPRQGPTPTEKPFPKLGNRFDRKPETQPAFVVGQRVRVGDDVPHLSDMAGSVGHVTKSGPAGTHVYACIGGKDSLWHTDNIEPAPLPPEEWKAGDVVRTPEGRVASLAHPLDGLYGWRLSNATFTGTAALTWLYRPEAD